MHEFHVWIGHCSNVDTLSDFFEEQYENPALPLNKFAESQSQRTYDHDGFEYGFQPEKTLEQWLDFSNGSDGYLSKAFRVSKEHRITYPNIYILANHDIFSNPKSIYADNLSVTYLGIFASGK